MSSNTAKKTSGAETRLLQDAIAAADAGLRLLLQADEPRVRPPLVQNWIIRSMQVSAEGEGSLGAIGGTAGFLVADVRGRLLGQVECPMYGRSPGEPDALAVRSGLLRRRHFIVPTTAIETIDERSQVIGLRLPSEDLERFL